jgi:hypothetical protein
MKKLIFKVCKIIGDNWIKVELIKENGSSLKEKICHLIFNSMTKEDEFKQPKIRWILRQITTKLFQDNPSLLLPIKEFYWYNLWVNNWNRRYRDLMPYTDMFLKLYYEKIKKLIIEVLYKPEPKEVYTFVGKCNYKNIFIVNEIDKAKKYNQRTIEKPIAILKKSCLKYKILEYKKGEYKEICL